MRKIIFRGKRRNGEWVQGLIGPAYYDENGPVEPFRDAYSIIAERRSYAVDQDTIGQYTGMDDKNGTPMPPAQWVKLRQNSSPRGSASMSPRIVAPVVVKPETVSKKQSTSDGT